MWPPKFKRSINTGGGRGNHRTTTEAVRETEDRTGIWRRWYRQIERCCLDMRPIQTQGSECLTRSDSLLHKDEMKLDPKFNYFGAAPHSSLLSHLRP